MYLCPKNQDKQTKAPWLTWLIAIILFITHLLSQSSSTDILRNYAFIPSLPFRHYGVTFFSYGFLHADWLHLLGNLYFFLMFGDDVECYLGKLKYLVTIFSTLIITSFFNFYFFPSDQKLHIGLSGAIMAIMILYGLIFRKSRIAYFIPHRLLYSLSQGTYAYVQSFSWWRIRAIWVSLSYITVDLILWLLDVNKFTNVSYSGHLIGAFCGLTLWVFFGLPNSYNPKTTHSRE